MAVCNGVHVLFLSDSVQDSTFRQLLTILCLAQAFASLNTQMLGDTA